MSNHKIVILITPFQLDQLKRVSDQFEIDFSNATFFISHYLDSKNVIQKLELNNPTLHLIPEFNASLARIVKSPFKEIGTHRKHIQKLKTFIRSKLEGKPECFELWIATEKDLFTQILMSIMYRKNKDYPINCFEEGLGFYSEITLKDKILKAIYPLVTPLLFGFKYEYFKCLGTHKDITNIYVRFPEEIPYRNPKARYHKITTKSAKITSAPTKDILFFSAPLSESSVCTKEKELVLFDQLFGALDARKINIDIKAHPREDVNKFNKYVSEKVHILEHRISGEELNYFDYRYIINLGSSIILDIHQREYPLSRVITLNMEHNYQIFTNKLFERGKHIGLFGTNLKAEFETILDSIEKV